MAFFEIIEGRPGQGKSLKTASTAVTILWRNKKWHKQGRPLRMLYSNIRFSKEVELTFPHQIVYWSDPEVICKIRDADVIWDEIAVHLDSRMFASLSQEMKRLLSQYRKRGLDIYANTQDLGMVDINARRVISGAKRAFKIIGSGDPSTTKPVVKKIWGIIALRNIENFRDVTLSDRKYDIIPEFLLITKELVDLYDTTQDIGVGILPKLKHAVQYCELHGTGECDHMKIIHS